MRTMRPATSLMRLVRSGLAAIAIAAPFAGAIPATTATAQVSGVEPYFVEVGQDNVYLRCGDGSVWYAIGKLDAGRVLKVDGEGFDWLRVAFPAGFGALVRDDEGALNEATGMVRLNRPTKLRFYNRDNGVVNSWKTLLDTPLPSGRELRHIETLRNEAGEAVGFLVEPPADARAFVSAQLTSRITEEEAMARLGTPLPQRPANEQQVAQAPNTTPAQPATTTPSQTQPSQTDRPVAQTPDDASDEAPIVPAGSSPTDSTSRPAAPVLTMQDNEESDAGRRVLTLAELREAFDRVIAAPILDAEIQPLIDEHQALFTALEGDDDAETIRPFLQTRIELLEIRLALQRQMERVDDVQARADEGAESMSSRIAEWQSRPEYLVVGRLTTSAIYDGKRLPLLYRLMSIEGGAGRTLAYIAPADGLDLNGKLGTIVGVVGEREGAAGLRAQVITPRRIEVLNP
jgi:hypothetical protein